MDTSRVFQSAVFGRIAGNVQLGQFDVGVGHQRISQVPFENQIVGRVWNCLGRKLYVLIPFYEDQTENKTATNWKQIEHKLKIKLKTKLKTEQKIKLKTKLKTERNIKLKINWKRNRKQMEELSSGNNERPDTAFDTQIQNKRKRNKDKTV